MRDRYDRDRGNNYGQDRGRSRSRSPNRYDRVPQARERSPVRSFHQAMMERSRSSHNGENAREPKNGGGFANGPHSSYLGEEEEGMIPQDEDDATLRGV